MVAAIVAIILVALRMFTNNETPKRVVVVIFVHRTEMIVELSIASDKMKTKERPFRESAVVVIAAAQRSSSSRGRKRSALLPCGDFSRL